MILMACMIVWVGGEQEGEKQTRLGGAHEGGASRGHEDSSPTQDLPNPQPPSKRRKVKSTRYAVLRLDLLLTTMQCRISDRQIDLWIIHVWVVRLLLSVGRG